MSAGVSMVGPLALVVCLNFVLFAITIATLRRTQRQSQHLSSTSSRQHLVIYVKLSTLTGLTWGVYLMAEFLDSHELRSVLLVTIGQVSKVYQVPPG